MRPQKLFERAVAGKKEIGSVLSPGQAPLINSCETLATPVSGEWCLGTRRFFSHSFPNSSAFYKKRDGQLSPGKSCVYAGDTPPRAGRPAGSPPVPG